MAHTPRAAGERLRMGRVFNWDNREPGNISYDNIIKNYFFPAPKFSPRRSAVRLARAPSRSWREIVNRFSGGIIQRVLRVGYGLFERVKLAIYNPPPATAPITQPVNWLHHNRFPRELRDKIHEHAHSPSIVVLDGKFASPIGLLGVDRRARQESMEVARRTCLWKLEYTSITTLISGLNTLPAGSLASLRNLELTSTGPYNGHSNRYGHNGFHRCNVCPTFHREDDTCWFEVEFACDQCEAQPFYERELEFAARTLLPKIERLTGLKLPVENIGMWITTREQGWRDGDLGMPSMRAYDVNEIFQPWKPARSESELARTDDLGRRWFGRRTAIRGLYAVETGLTQREEYLIL